MKDRIKKIRERSELTQQKFADRLGLKRQTIAAYEIGNIEPSESTQLLICKEFGINKEWLQHGTEPMENPITKDDRYRHNIAKLTRVDDESITRWVNAIAETNPDVLKEIEEFMKKILGIT